MPAGAPEERGAAPSSDLDIPAIRDALLRWYAVRARDLPWRRTDDPYAVWISEVMLQQTRVDTVAPYFERWMRAFPDVDSLASASHDEVLRHWQGLGYYSRARNLHRAARQIAETPGGRLPRTAEALRALPGIGPYTAGAVASIAHGEAVPAIDGNARRVLARMAAVEQRVDRADGRRQVQSLAEALLEDADAPAGDINQALMELGATVCRPSTPDCGRCPVADQCEARARGIEAQLPRSGPRQAPREAHAFAWILRSPPAGFTGSERLLVARRPDAGLLAGLWEFPMTLAEPDADAPSILHDHIGMTPDELHRRSSLVHVFSHLRLAITPCEISLGTQQPAPPGGVRDAPRDDPVVPGGRGYATYRWLGVSEIARLPRSALMVRLEAAVGLDPERGT